MITRFYLFQLTREVALLHVLLIHVIPLHLDQLVLRMQILHALIYLQGALLLQTYDELDGYVLRGL